MKFISALCAFLLACTASMAQDYRLQPEDVLRIEVLEDPALNQETFVLPDGTINFPLAGVVRAGGRTIPQLERALSRALAPDFATEPTVFVSVLRVTEPEETITVYVLGEIANPGAREIEHGTQLLQFLAQAGQFTRFAALKRLQLRRPGVHGHEKHFVINLKAIQNGAKLQSNLILREGDVLVVPTRRLFE